MSDGRLPAQIWYHAQDRLIGYGYRPRRAFGWLSVLWGIGVLVFCVWPPEKTRATGGQSLSAVGHLTYPLDLIMPVVGFGPKGLWEANHLGTQILAAVLVAAGWLLGATVIAGITRVVKRS